MDKPDKLETFFVITALIAGTIFAVTLTYGLLTATAGK